MFFHFLYKVAPNLNNVKSLTMIIVFGNLIIELALKTKEC